MWFTFTCYHLPGGHLLGCECPGGGNCHEGERPKGQASKKYKSVSVLALFHKIKGTNAQFLPPPSKGGFRDFKRKGVPKFCLERGG